MLADPRSWLHSNTALTRLATEVLSMAVRDAIHPTPVMGNENREGIQREARSWLNSLESDLFFDVAGYEPTRAAQWIQAGCPAPDKNNSSWDFQGEKTIRTEERDEVMVAQDVRLTDFSTASFAEIEETYEGYNRRIEEIDREVDLVKKQIEQGREQRQNTLVLHQQVRVLEAERADLIRDRENLLPVLTDAREWAAIQKQEAAVERYQSLASQIGAPAVKLYRLLDSAYRELCQLHKLQIELNNAFREAGSLSNGLNADVIQVPAETVENHLHQALEAIERVNYRFSTSTYPAMDEAGLQVDGNRKARF